MRAKPLALLVLALGCGLVASLGITQVISKRGSEAAPPDTQPVSVAVKEIPLGAIIAADSIKAEEWPKDRVPTGALGKQEEVEGRRTKAKFFPGEPILEQKLFGKGAGDPGIGGLIPKGLRVVSVRVDPVTIHGGLVMPGSRVDIQVYVHCDPANGITETATHTILQDIKVFAVNDVVSLDNSGESKSIPGRTVSLLVTPNQAEKITLAGEMGTIRLIMRSPDDDIQAPTRGETPTGLFGGHSEGSHREKEKLVADPEPPKEPPAASSAGKSFGDYLGSLPGKSAAAKPDPVVPPPAAPDAARWSMRVLRGSEVSEVELEENASAGPSDTGGGWRMVNGLPELKGRPEPHDAKRPVVPAEPEVGRQPVKPAQEGPKPGQDQPRVGQL
ncbi:MAG: Flp pilus assembly protein CpaB [Thermoguttaceae bacterium]|jgi:pilus assembly protein CpaB